MYGVRGSTVPAKYLKQEQQQDNIPRTVTNTTPIYNEPARPEYCSNCGMGLATAQDMKRHLEQHETCPSEGCNFAALANILERHVEANHITGIYTKVKKVWTPEDIAAWRAERRKKFPTAANVETAKRAKEQRQKRGERLEASRERFGKREDRQRTRPQTNSKERSKQTKKRRNNTKQTPATKHTKKVETEATKQEEEIKVSSTGVPMFRGTSQMSNYKHIKSKADSNALSNMLGMYGTDSEEEEQDESMDDDASNKDCEDQPTNILEAMEQSKVSSSSDEAPDEQPIVRIKDVASSANHSPAEKTAATTDTPIVTTDTPTSSTHIADKPTSSKIAQRPAVKKRHYGLNFKRARQISKQTTMLSKLLEKDIRHERNVLLQCVRYVCEQNFFGIGTTSVKETI
ncbi:Nufip [Drosophila busckii]|uniref:Nufip n=1 Tax=Drosophila busckii TaxID=30019 RepID=A0A0M4ELP9_DROBS|nr:Nufip [Drosophila busckii]